MKQRVGRGEQEALATARFIRISPTKVRQVVDLIRDRHVDDARRVLRFSARAASKPVGKVLESAIANAEHNRGLPADELVVTRAWVDEGPTLRRYRPRALGRATRIRKRTCHISVVVGREPEAEVAQAPRAAAKSSAKSTAKSSAKSTAKSTARTARRERTPGDAPETGSREEKE